MDRTRRSWPTASSKHLVRRRLYLRSQKDQQAAVQMESALAARLEADNNANSTLGIIIGGQYDDGGQQAVGDSKTDQPTDQPTLPLADLEPLNQVPLAGQHPI